MYSGDQIEKVIRKRVLLSSDYRTALKKKSIFEVYFELNQSHWVTDANQCLKHRKLIQKTLQDLATKYENGVVYKAPPKREKKKKQFKGDRSVY